MSRPFALPDLGEGLTEAEIVKVLVREGDVIAEDAPLIEVETDKATVEIPSPFSGRVSGIHVQPGQTVKVGHVLVTFDDAAVVTAGRGGGGGGRGGGGGVGGGGGGGGGWLGGGGGGGGWGGGGGGRCRRRPLLGGW